MTKSPTHRIIPNPRINHGPVFVIEHDGSTVLVTRMTDHCAYPFWVSADLIEEIK